MKILVKGIFIIHISLKWNSIEPNSDSKLELNKQAAVVREVSVRTTFTIFLQSCILQMCLEMKVLFSKLFRVVLLDYKSSGK